MKAADVRALYGDDCAALYNSLWHGGVWASDTQHLLEAIGRRVTNSSRWLDVGCGTGYFLSHFPGVQRAGIDLSPSMLAKARVANPDALFFREADFRDNENQWQDEWTIVTCTGEPYSYVESMKEIETLVANLACWTSPAGMCLLAVQDVTDLAGLRLPYPINGRPGFPGDMYIKALVWSMKVADRLPYRVDDQEDLIWPTLEHWIHMFAQHFRRIEIEHLPHDPPFLHTPRRVLVGSQKRSNEKDHRPPSIVYTGTVGSTRRSEPLPATNSVNREYSPKSDYPLRPLRDLSVGYILERLRPWTPAFWRAISRRVRHRFRPG